MHRRLLAVAVLAVGAVRGSAGELTATLIGNAGLHITDGANALLVDFPYESGAFGYMEWSEAKVPRGPRPLCLFTHAHADHFRPDLVAAWCATVAGPPEVTRRASGPTIASADPIRWHGLLIHPIATPHGSVDHNSYLVEWAGQRLYMTGDTESTTGLRAARGLDVAFVTPWLLGAVAREGARVDARRIVVYHHRAGEGVAAVQESVVPAQGDVLVLASRRESGPRPAPSADSPLTVDDGFAAALAEAERNMEGEAGRAYHRGPFSTRFVALYPSAYSACMADAGEPADFEMVIRLGASGAVEEALVNPRAKFATCVSAAIARETFPKPPGPAWRVPLSMRVTRK